jgi:serine/threonine protein kinase
MNHVNNKVVRSAFQDLHTDAKFALRAKDLRQDPGIGAKTLFARKDKGSVIASIKNRLFDRVLVSKKIAAALKEVTSDHRIWQDPLATAALIALEGLVKRGHHDIDTRMLCKNLDAIAKWREQNTNPISFVANSIASPAFRKLEAKVAKALRNGNTAETEALAKEMGGLFAQELSSLPPRERMKFALLDDNLIKYALKAALVASPGVRTLMKEGLTPENAAQFDDFLAKVVVEVLPDQVAKNKQSLILNGKKYVFDRHIAKGGFGSVDSYTCDGHTIILKTPLKEGKQTKQMLADLIADTKAEGIAHLAATAGEPKNIIGLEGILRMADGSIAIAVEIALNGSVDGARQYVHNAESNENGNPKLNKKEAMDIKLTILQASLASVAHLHKGGISHVDVKGPNYLVGTKGDIYLGDFGLSKLQDMQFREKNPVDMPTYADPLMRQKFSPIETKRKDIDKDKLVIKEYFNVDDKTLNELNNQMNAKVDPDEKAAIESILKNKRAEGRNINRLADIEKRRDAPGFQMSGFAADKWSLGVMAFELFTNKRPFDESGFLEDTWEDQKSFLAMTDEQQRHDKLFTGITDDVIPPEVKQMILKLLSPQEEDRPAPSDLLKHNIFNNPNVGSKETKSLLAECIQQGKAAEKAAEKAAG